MSETSKRPTTHPDSATIERWEDSNALLAAAVTSFLDSSTLLENQYTSRDANSGDLVSRIGSSLDYLQTTIDRQLKTARLALAKTHNRLTRSIISLPRELLSEIFINVVFDPIDDDDPWNLAIDMDRRVELIYRRLHTLLGVCVSWRNAGLACGALWSVVPVVDPKIGSLRPQSTELSLHRAGENGLHLVISLSRSTPQRLDPLIEHLSRFSTINIHQKDRDTISLTLILTRILDHVKPGILSRLSNQGMGDWAVRPFPGYYPPTLLELSATGLMDTNIHFVQLIQSLSTLRIQGVSLHWESINFSTHLSTLRLSKLSLGQSMHSLISALSTANELRELEFVSIRALMGANDDGTNARWHRLNFPKLKSLYLGDLNFNVFRMLKNVIAPGSYKIAVNITVEIWTSYISVEPNDHMTCNSTGHMLREACELLRAVAVDKLILEERGFRGVWNEGDGLRAILESVPRVKSLILNRFPLETITLQALKQLPRPSHWSSTREPIFPKLEAIEFHCAKISPSLSHLKPGFRDLLANHPISRIVIGKSTLYDDTFVPIDEHDEVIKWLKSKIPQFYLFRGEQYEVPNADATWQLWDI